MESKQEANAPSIAQNPQLTHENEMPHRTTWLETIQNAVTRHPNRWKLLKSLILPLVLGFVVRMVREMLRQMRPHQPPHKKVDVFADRLFKILRIAVSFL